MATNFSEIPFLDYNLLTTDETRSDFVSQLLKALTTVGFFYLCNSPITNSDLIDKVIDYAPRFFDLPDEEKERIRMVHSPHFFGYSRFGAELTKGKVDQREQFDVGTPYSAVQDRWKPGDPDYLRLWGPSQVCLELRRSFGARS
jgi:isopenicillin N synthase-like dioxygenase